MTPPPTRDAKRKSPTERFDQLLGRAVEIFSAEGLSAVTLRRVAADLGVTPGLVSHYFASADQLLIATFRAAAEADLATAHTRADGYATAREQLDAVIAYAFDECNVEANALWVDAWSLGRRNAALAQEAEVMTREWLQWLGDIIRHGQVAGEFGPVDADVAARRILTIIDGLGAQQVVRGVDSGELTYIARMFADSELSLNR